MYVCHCDDVTLGEIVTTIGDRKFISVDEIKHTTRLGMGACRGKRCIRRLKQVLRNKGISVVGEATPRGPLSNQLAMGELFPKNVRENIIISNSKTSCPYCRSSGSDCRRRYWRKRIVPVSGRSRNKTSAYQLWPWCFVA